MVGSGNVGLIVTYQLLQAGADVKAILEAAPRLSGYAVHAGKVRRAGVPILLGHTVTRAFGEEALEAVEIAQVDDCFAPIPGTETHPLRYPLSRRGTDAPGGAGRCERMQPGLGPGPWAGCSPGTTGIWKNSRPNILVAGDLAGIEEASTALDEGRLAGSRRRLSSGTTCRRGL